MCLFIELSEASEDNPMGGAPELPEAAVYGISTSTHLPSRHHQFDTEDQPEVQRPVSLLFVIGLSYFYMLLLC